MTRATNKGDEIMTEEITTEELELARALQKCQDMYAEFDESWAETDRLFRDAMNTAKNIVLARAGTRQAYRIVTKEREMNDEGN